jgi:hypothetical protein
MEEPAPSLIARTARWLRHRATLGQERLAKRQRQIRAWRDCRPRGMVGGMPLSTPFGRATWKLDALLIWSGGLSGLAWFLSWLQGIGVGYAFLLALAAFPLAFLTCVLIRYRREIQQYITGFFSSHTSGGAAAYAQSEQKVHTRRAPRLT